MQNFSLLATWYYQIVGIFSPHIVDMQYDGHSKPRALDPGVSLLLSLLEFYKLAV